MNPLSLSQATKLSFQSGTELCWPSPMSKPLAPISVPISWALLTFEDVPGRGLCLYWPSLYVVANRHLHAECPEGETGLRLPFGAGPVIGCVEWLGRRLVRGQHRPRRVDSISARVADQRPLPVHCP